MLSQHDAIGQATAYINRLEESIQELKTRKELAARSDGSSESRSGSEQPPSSILPVVEMGLWDSGLEVTLISGMDKRFTLSEAISILEEEGAEAVRASVSTIGGKVFHTICAQAILPRVGVETSRVSERLHKLVFSF
ncbi:uncharacterized protein J3R85_008492 [Psidium guajava]|nr:uncharacterized protein J3R85_008492 [Psidium guajava]